MPPNHMPETLRMVSMRARLSGTTGLPQTAPLHPPPQILLRGLERFQNPADASQTLSS